VSVADLLREAADELYSGALEEFVERRSALAARAREAGDKQTAKQIVALRKPTRSAWVLNQLARTAPDAASQLADLGAEFRAAQESLDGAAIRELSVRRRKLIDALTRQAFAVAGQPTAASLAEEVTATLGAALADPQIAGQLRAGTLERAIRTDGLGPADGAPTSSVAAPTGMRRGSAAPRTAAAGPAAGGPAAGGGAAGGGAAGGRAAQSRSATKALRAAERAQAERARYRQAIADAERAMGAAERAAAEADQAADAAATVEQDQEGAVRLIEAQLAAARSELADARLRTHKAITRQLQARRALDRLREQPAPAPPHEP
jgi:hypothetical protein